MSKLIFIFIPSVLFFAFQNFKAPKPLPSNEIELGKLLFFDPILSANNKISCASCHKPQYAFADNVPFSKGIHGKLTQRNTPSILNLANRSALFWDGRSPNLEEQALHPIKNEQEMGMQKIDFINRLKKNTFYSKAFLKIYNKPVAAELIGKAIAAYERTLETDNSAFDKFMLGDSAAISISAMRGRDIFLNKGKCFDCHFGPDFTGDEYKNIGLFNGKNWNDSGRFNFSHNANDIGKFKVPGLRNVALTAPYMHNGSFQTLESVIEFYNNPDAIIPNSIGRDSLLMKPLELNDTEKSDLLSFLLSLTSYSFNTAKTK
jgi:cytochrome c peroxidase